MGGNLVSPKQNSPMRCVLNADSRMSAVRLYFRPFDSEKMGCRQSQTLSELTHRICFEYGLYDVSCEVVFQTISTISLWFDVSLKIRSIR